MSVALPSACRLAGQMRRVTMTRKQIQAIRTTASAHLHGALWTQIGKAWAEAEVPIPERAGVPRQAHPSG